MITTLLRGKRKYHRENVASTPLIQTTLGQAMVCSHTNLPVHCGSRVHDYDACTFLANFNRVVSTVSSSSSTAGTMNRFVTTFQKLAFCAQTAALLSFRTQATALQFINDIYRYLLRGRNTGNLHVVVCG